MLDGWRENVIREILQQRKRAIKELNPAPEICEAANSAVIRGQISTTALDFEGKVEYTRSDIYSLGMMIVKMFALYQADDFYEYEPSIKVSTRMIENAIMKINTLHEKLASTLNKMLVYDCFERVSFSYLDEVINGDKDVSPIKEASMDHLNPIARYEHGARLDNTIEESFGLGSNENPSSRPR